MKLVVPLAIALLGLGAGVGAGLALKPEPPKETGTDVVQYLGPVRLGNKTLALLSIHGKQRFAGLNDSTDDGVVTEITSEHVTLTLRDIERKIDRAARGNSGPQWMHRRIFAMSLEARPRFLHLAHHQAESQDRHEPGS